MAKAAWCTVSPMSGKENAPISITVPAYTGRLARNTTVTVTNKNGTKPSKAITANQASAGNILTLDSTKPDVPNTGGTVTINGTSNSAKLKWSTTLTLMGIEASFDGSTIVKVNNAAISNDTAINGDPGAAAKYNFIATIVLDASPFAVDVLVTFKVEDGTGNSKVCTFTWKAGASTLSVDKSALNFAATGGTQNVNVTSNDEWTVS